MKDLRDHLEEDLANLAPLGGELEALWDHLALAGLKPSWAESPIDLATFPPIAGKSPGERANHPKSPHLSTIPRLPTPPKPVNQNFNPKNAPKFTASLINKKKNTLRISTVKMHLNLQLFNQTKFQPIKIPPQ